ncbi:hypothetical protein CASFOL_008176 [Castilleja foliolosa]|uniref:Uncharacterized protein n=1 Tax=Castilleja foliolosa TaxID=1961234 RepID=A0ABD3DYI5_9LAMI
MEKVNETLQKDLDFQQFGVFNSGATGGALRDAPSISDGTDLLTRRDAVLTSLAGGEWPDPMLAAADLVEMAWLQLATAAVDRRSYGDARHDQAFAVAEMEKHSKVAELWWRTVAAVGGEKATAYMTAVVGLSALRATISAPGFLRFEA